MLKKNFVGTSRNTKWQAGEKSPFSTNFHYRYAIESSSVSNVSTDFFSLI